MKDVSQIPELRLSRLQKLVQRFTTAPSLVLMKLFGEDKWDSEDIEWESEQGNRGMTPFSGENLPAPRVQPTGTASHKAKAAFWKEKMYLAAKFLNNIRMPGTTATYHRASEFLAKQTMMLRNRCDRRKEWMFAKMISNGAFDYKDADGNVISVDYGIPAANKVTLGTTDKWNYNAADTTKNILQDIMDAQLHAKATISREYDQAMFTQEILNLMIMDTGIQNLLKKSSFGDGDLFARPLPVLGSLLNIPKMVLYDEVYQLKSWLTAALAAGAGPHTIYADNLSDFEVGMTAYVMDVSAKRQEALTITAVNVLAGTLTATGTLSYAYQAGADLIYVTKKFLPTTKFTMFASSVEGQKVAEFGNAPFDLDRHFGMKIDKHEEWDPDGVYVRAQNKGLPVLYFEDAVYQLTVL